MSGKKPSTAPARELLVANHSFPGEYIVKAFGPGADPFCDNVVAAAEAVVGASRVEASWRATRSGSKICVTLTLAADTVDEVLDVYARIHEVPGLLLIL